MCRSSLKSGRRSSRAPGFTLVEILIVVVIIAILAALLFPVFARVREKARQVTCTSNLRQLGAAVLMYAQDYDETMPRWGNSFAPDQYITALLDPYLKAQAPASGERKSVWVCPSRVALTAASNSYGYNYLVLGNLSASKEPYLARYNTPASLSSLQQPASTIAFADAIDVIRPPYGVQAKGMPDTIGSWHQSTDYTVEPVAVAGSAWVNGDPSSRVFILWADGHVKSLSRAALTPPSRGGTACNDDLWDRVKPSPYTISGASCP